jgi:hypothetical protein
MMSHVAVAVLLMAGCLAAYVCVIPRLPKPPVE